MVMIFCVQFPHSMKENNKNITHMAQNPQLASLPVTFHVVRLSCAHVLHAEGTFGRSQMLFVPTI